MTCLICHGNDIRLEQINEELQLGSDVVKIPIEVLVCQTCGERYYDRRTIQFLERTERQLRDGAAHVREVGRVLLLE